MFENYIKYDNLCKDLIEYKKAYCKEFFVAEFIGGIFSTIFGSHSWLATILISMFPIIELKGAIPVGMNVEFWGENALGSTSAFLLSLLGSCLVVPILALIFKPVINWLKNTKLFKKLGSAIEEKVHKHSSSIEQKSEGEARGSKKKVFLKMLGVFMFVSVPIPLTGVWTGTCIAVALGLKFWQICVSAILGNMIAGIIITCVCSVFPQFTTIIFLIVLAFVVAIVVYTLIKMLIGKKQVANTDNVKEDKGE